MLKEVINALGYIIICDALGAGILWATGSDIKEALKVIGGISLFMVVTAIGTYMIMW